MESIENEIIALLSELNFKKAIINNSEVYESEGQYLKLTFLNKLKSYVIVASCQRRRHRKTTQEYLSDL